LAGRKIEIIKMPIGKDWKKELRRERDEYFTEIGYKLPEIDS